MGTHTRVRKACVILYRRCQRHSTKCSPSTATRFQVGVTHRSQQRYAPVGSLTFETGSQPPSLLITVSGNVTHGGGPGANPASTHKKNIEGHPRVFSQTFMLVPDNTAPTKAGEVAKYYIIADTMRFVG
jgi:hypothetical protein